MPQTLLDRHAALSSRPALKPLYNAYLLAHAMAHFEPAACPWQLPASVRALYPRELQRILRRIDARADCDLDADSFRKDLAILHFRLIPVGAEFATPDSGLPRRVLFANGVGQALRACALLARTGGVRPFFELHAHVLSLDDFHPAGWEATYARLAELLALNPRVRGWMSSSWFLDPALERISPRLSYLRTVPQQHGATLLFVGLDRAGTSGALARSPTRRQLFEQGRYVPATYMRVWPRRAVLRWFAGRSAADQPPPSDR